MFVWVWPNTVHKYCIIVMYIWHICIHICVRIYVYMYIHMYKHIYTNMYIYTHIYTCVYIYMYIYIYTYTCVYTYICIYMFEILAFVIFQVRSTPCVDTISRRTCPSRLLHTDVQNKSWIPSSLLNWLRKKAIKLTFEKSHVLTPPPHACTTLNSQYPAHYSVNYGKWIQSWLWETTPSHDSSACMYNV